MRLAGFSVFLIGFVLILVPVGLGWMTLWGTTHPPCSIGPEPAQVGLEAEEVSVPSRHGVAFRGYFLPGSNGATIIVPPAYGQDRGGWLHEVAVLVAGGYNVLTYDSRPCTGMSPHSLGVWESGDILDALAYLRQRPDVDMSRIGAHGFSQAGASALFAAAQAPEIRAVVAEGGYVDYGAQTLGIGGPQDPVTALFSLGARLGYRSATGMSLSQLKPLDVIAAIAPRRVLLIYGEHEVTLAGAQYAATLGAHIDLWIVSGATHGSYLTSAGQRAFTERVVGFFDAALQPVGS
ncbi:MAG: prolyl oligopeptidase family serine peptidase [Anaerolineae bacterium]|nr:prolyl oligopeptidase family serine peptidase [Anaerolineae bacterium]